MENITDLCKNENIPNLYASYKRRKSMIDITRNASAKSTEN